MATVLIVDDRAVNREFLASLLGYKRHRVLEAEDGVQALEIARAEIPDLVISDVLMPNMDGYDLVRALHAVPRLASIPVIFSTAHYNEQEARKLAQACGVARILPKPCDPEIVLDAVGDALGGEPPVPAPRIDDSAFDREHFRLLTGKLSEKVDGLLALSERQAALIDFAMELGSARDPAQLFKKFAYAARTIVAAKHAVVAILDAAAEQFQHVATSGMTPALEAVFVPPPPRQGLLAGLLDGGAPIVEHGAAGDPGRLGLPPEHPPVSSVVAVPVASSSRIYGWLCLTNKLGLEAFSDDERDLAGVLADMVARIHENNLLYAEIERRNAQLAEEIAERRAAERALRQSEARFRDVAEAATDWIWELDDALRFTFVSERIRDVGFDPAQLIGRPWSELGSAAENPAWQAHLDGMRDRQPFRDVTHELRPTDKGRHVIKLTGKPRFDPAGTFLGYCGTGTDVTALFDSEQQLRQALKMEAVGQLTGGIAHDFNNLLTVISSSSEVIAEELGDHELAAPAADIVHAARRGAQLTHRLLAFSRRQALAPIRADVQGLIEGMRSLLQRTLGEHIDIKIKGPSNGWFALVDPSQFENAVLNLAINARDAMPRGGTLAIESSNVELHPADARVGTDVAPGSYVMVSVGDTGTGIPPEIIERVFEPFFTTKETGRGSGLGLSMIYGFVKQSNGHVAVESTVGQGTTIKLYLPRASSGQVEAKSAARAERPATTTGETILVVEDDALVRSSLVRQLKRMGYRIVQAENGADALDKLVATPIDLLFTDMIMPGGMTGQQLAEQARHLHPRLRILFTSGYADQAREMRGALEPGMSWLPKPYSREDLARLLRQVLES